MSYCYYKSQANENVPNVQSTNVHLYKSITVHVWIVSGLPFLLIHRTHYTCTVNHTSTLILCLMRLAPAPASRQRQRTRGTAYLIWRGALFLSVSVSRVVPLHRRSTRTRTSASSGRHCAARRAQAPSSDGVEDRGPLVCSESAAAQSHSPTISQSTLYTSTQISFYSLQCAAIRVSRREDWRNRALATTSASHTRGSDSLCNNS